MTVFDYITISLGLVIVLFFQYICYSKLSNKKLELDNVLKIVVSIVIIAAFAFNTYFIFSFTQLLISFILTFISNFLIFKDSFKECFIRSLVFYIIMALSEILLSFVIYLLPYTSSMEFDISSFYKVSISLVVYILTYLIICRKVIIKITEFLIYKIKIDFYIFLTLIC